MASVLTVGTSPVATASARRGAPRKMFRGVRRTLIRKALAKLTSIVNSDFRENTRAAVLQYDAALIAGVTRSADRNAFDRVVQRLSDALKAKEGDDF